MIHQQFRGSTFNFATGILLALLIGCQTTPEHMPITLDYPNSRTEDVKDTLWGIEVSDPYRWMEDDRSEETMAWVDTQINFTRAYLDRIPWRAPLRNRFETLYNYEKIGMPRKIGSRYFLSKNDGLQNQSVW